mmetsp:Transcript_44662/g.80090  ORF Transcript_44662/g.80090 Transcript_44662/m.80090 type:complete len:230 (-) Transcript_44662:446-1135(-)
MKKHGVQLREEGRETAKQRGKQRPASGVTGEGESRNFKELRKRYPQEDTEYMPLMKRNRESLVQALLDLGPLLPVVLHCIPRRLCQVTYIDLDNQFQDEGHRRRMVRLEELDRQLVATSRYIAMRDLCVRHERLQRWMIHVLDRRQRSTLWSLGRAALVEVHYRERTVHFEAMARDHLTGFLILAQEGVCRRWVKGLQEQTWANLLTSARIQKYILGTAACGSDMYFPS